MKSPLHPLLFGVSVLTAVLLLLSNIMGTMAVQQMATDLEDVENTTSSLRNHMQVDMMHDAIRADVNAALLSREGITDIRQVRDEFSRHTRELHDRIAANTRLPLGAATRHALLDVSAPLENYRARANAIITLVETGHSPPRELLADFKQHFTTLEGRMARVSERIEREVSTTSGMGEANAAALRDVLQASSILSLGLFALATMLQFRVGLRWFDAAAATIMSRFSHLIRLWRRLWNVLV